MAIDETGLTKGHVRKLNAVPSWYGRRVLIASIRFHTDVVDPRNIGNGCESSETATLCSGMLLRNFCDDGGFLWVGDQSAGIAIRRNLRNVFVEGNLYSTHDYIHGTDSYEYEHALSKIEGNAKAAISSIIEQVRGGRNPHLGSELNKHLKKFVLALARRTPESQERVFTESDRNFEEVFDSVAKELLVGAGYEVPEQDWFDRDPDVLEMKRRMKSNHSANLRQESIKFCERNQRDSRARQVGALH